MKVGSPSGKEVRLLMGQLDSTFKQRLMVDTECLEKRYVWTWYGQTDGQRRTLGVSEDSLIHHSLISPVYYLTRLKTRVQQRIYFHYSHKLQDFFKLLSLNI